MTIGKDHIKSYFAKHNQTDKDGKSIGPKMSKIDEDYLQKVQDKISKVGFETVIRLVSVSPDAASSKVNLSNLERAFGQFNSPSFNSFGGITDRYQKYYVQSFISRMFPIVERINLLRSKGSAAPIELPESGLYLGKSVFRSDEVKIFMEDEDRRRHMYILRTTGTGKSEFMKFMAIQDIKNGKGVAFIDPHGSAVNDIVQQIPP